MKIGLAFLASMNFWFYSSTQQGNSWKLIIYNQGMIMKPDYVRN